MPAIEDNNYLAASVLAAHPPAAPVPPLPHQNHVHIIRSNADIKGVFVIDPSMPSPPSAPYPYSPGGKEVSVFSKNGNVDVGLYLVGKAKEAKGRVELEAGSNNGWLKFAVRDRPQAMPVHISTKADNGWQSLSLPRTFRGPLTITHKNGQVSFSPSVAAVTQILEEDGSEMCCWVGEWKGEKAEEGEWVGDEAVVWAANGHVKVGFWEDGDWAEEEDGRGVGGFLKSVFGCGCA